MGPIEIILSATVQKRWRVKPAGRASEPPVNWLGQWRIDFGNKSGRTSVALVTNTTTLYTFIFPEKDLGEDDNFEKLFRLRIGFSIVEVPALAGWKAAPISFVTGNPRMAIGAMNNLRQHMVWRAETAGGQMEDAEEWINNTPFASLPEHFPNDAFAKRLAETPERAKDSPRKAGGRKTS